MMLSERELADMRSQQEENMPETVFIQKKVSISNGAGGFFETWETESTVTGRIGPVGKSAEEKEIAARLSGVIGYTVILPHDAVVDEKKQLQIDGRQFFVAGVPKKSNQTALRVVVAEVK